MQNEDAKPEQRNAVLYAPHADPVWLVIVAPDGHILVNDEATEQDWKRTKERAPDVYTVAHALSSRAG